MRTGALLAGGLLALVATAAAGGEPVKVEIEVAEPAGLERKAAHVTSGVPLPAGFKDLAKLVLKNAGGKAVPCQFSPLGKRADGAPYWVLLDFQTDLGAKARAKFTLSDAGGNPAPAEPVKVTETKKAITVDNGLIKFRVSKTNFNFLDAVWLGGEKVAEAGKTAQLWITEGVKNTKLESRGTGCYRAAVEYAGPLRAGLRLDGTFTKGDMYFLHYSIRIECFAGKSDLHVSFKLRNSQKDWAFNSYIKEAGLELKLAGGGKEIKSAGWAGVSGEKASLAVASRFARHQPGAAVSGAADGSVRFRPYAAPGWLEKHMEHEWQLLFRFKKGALSAGEMNSAMKGFGARPLALAEGKWYQKCNALGGPIGMLEDEINTYKAWGWKINKRGQPRPSGKTFIKWLEVHDVSETDSARDNLWQYVRTRDRGFFDVGEAYVFYYRNPYMFHWDEGFDPDKLVPGKELDRTPFPKIRRDRAAMKRLRRSRMCICHSYAAGLVDHYLLTGESASLEAAEDFCRYIEDQYKEKVPGKDNPNGGRYFGRPFQNVCRVFEVTRKPRWKKLMTRMAQVALQAPARDERGLISGARPASEWNKYAKQRGGVMLLDALEKKGIKAGPIPTKGWSSWEFSIFNHSIGRYYDLTGDEDARDMLIAQAWFTERYCFEPVHKHTGYICVLDFPLKGDAYIPGMSGVPHPPNCVHNGWYTKSCPDNLTRGYRLTGRKAFLEMAKIYWNRGSKVGYQQPESRRVPDNESGAFASAHDPKDGNLMYVKELFYVWLHQKKDSAPPEAITDLKAKALGKGRVQLTWKAPKDDSGKAAAYQVKWAAMPIKTYAKYNYRLDEGKFRCWWRASNVKGEPAPGKPGRREKFVVTGLKPGTCYFAVKSDDAEMNQSDISNVVKVEVK